VRTCPACGEDTKAETTEPCTECGFSPVGTEDEAPWEESVWAEEAAPEAPEPPPQVTTAPAPSDAEPQASTTAPAPAEAPGYGFPDEPEPPAPARSRPRVAPIWIVLILVGIAWQAFNLFDGCGEIFSDKPGPTAEESESALEDDAALQGLTGANVACPDSAEDTEVGANFECTITSASGESANVTVTNREDNFEWSRAPFFRLQRGGG
jgi:Domain of unknown function (DUF4333)